MSIALVPCADCSHRRGLHKGGGKCGQPACSCPAFHAVVEAPADEELRGKVIQIAVPEGYAVTVTLTPVEPIALLAGPLEETVP